MSTVNKIGVRGFSMVLVRLINVNDFVLTSTLDINSTPQTTSYNITYKVPFSKLWSDYCQPQLLSVN